MIRLVAPSASQAEGTAPETAYDYVRAASDIQREGYWSIPRVRGRPYDDTPSLPVCVGGARPRVDFMCQTLLSLYFRVTLTEPPSLITTVAPERGNTRCGPTLFRLLCGSRPSGG